MKGNLPAMRRQQMILFVFLASVALNAGLALREPNWLALPAMALGWYVADMLSGLIHMYMDYRPCTPGKRLNDIFFYEGSRESDEYLTMLRQRMATIGPFERISYDFKNHHPRPDALGRRPLWRLIGSTVVLAALPVSLLGNLAGWFLPIPGWLFAGLVAFLIGGAFAQYFHGSLHRAHNPWFIAAMRRVGLLMTPAAHQVHHDTLQRDFATNCGWSNPAINRLFRTLRARGMLDDRGLVPSA
ncbi:MAG: carotenoid synthesis regulator CarF [Sphingomonadales bacterium]|nr:carotenoid synthesis regulator CarF [Sphingomonadales bacterium]